MSLADILKNVYTFLEILQASRTNAVITYDENSVRNAFQWATYCEQIYKQAKHRSYYQDLDRQVRALAKVPVAIGTEKIDLELLGRSVDLLQQALLRNPHLDHAKLLDLVLRRGYEVKIENAQELIQTANQPTTDLHKVLDQLSESGNELLQATMLASAMKAQARLLDKHIENLLEFITTERVRIYLMNKLEHIANETRGLEVIFNVLHLIMDTTDTDNVKLSKETFLKTWLLDYCSSKSYRWLWCVPLETLATVASKWHEFYVLYMKTLVEMADCMYPDYSTPQMTWRLKQLDKATFSDACTFKMLCKHVESLTVNEATSISGETKETLDRLCSKENFTLWEDVRTVISSVNS